MLSERNACLCGSVAFVTLYLERRRAGALFPLVSRESCSLPLAYYLHYLTRGPHPWGIIGMIVSSGWHRDLWIHPDLIECMRDAGDGRYGPQLPLRFSSDLAR